MGFLCPDVTLKHEDQTVLLSIRKLAIVKLLPMLFHPIEGCTPKKQKSLGNIRLWPRSENELWNMGNEVIPVVMGALGTPHNNWKEFERNIGTQTSRKLPSFIQRGFSEKYITCGRLVVILFQEQNIH